MEESDRTLTRRDALRAGAAIGAGTASAGCTVPGGGDGGALFSEGFENGFEGWETTAAIGPEVDVSEFEWTIDRTQAQAVEGAWSLEIFTEGDYDDGTAWVTTELSVPADASAFDVTCEAWSQSESFNMLRNIVFRLGPEKPTTEEDFPDPGMNSTAVAGAPYGGLREPLHLAEGWREYGFSWESSSVPKTLYLSVGVSVVWESDATHYIDSISVEEQ